MGAKKVIRPPAGAVRLQEIGDRVWAFQFPRLDSQVHDKLNSAIDLWRVGDILAAKARFKELIAAYPEFIDAHHHLALILEATGRDEEAFDHWQGLVAMGLKCLPARFEVGYDQLPWLDIDNRPFLRAYHALGIEYVNRDDIAKALEIFSNLVAMNPNDNQGARSLVAECLFHLGRPAEVLHLCEQYSDDGMEGVVYGRPLALFQLGRREEADESLDAAIDFLPLVAGELIKDEHSEPEATRPGYITHGGADQAYYYWHDFGEYWEDTEGALPFLEAGLDRYERRERDE